MYTKYRSVIVSVHSICIQHNITDYQQNKPVGEWISVPSPNFVAMATRSAHNILHDSIESAIPKNPLVGPNISGLSAIQADLCSGE